MKAYVARDSIGKLYIFAEKPRKGKFWWVGCAILSWKDEYLPEGINPKWSDKEPIEVELKLEKI